MATISVHDPALVRARALTQHLFAGGTAVVVLSVLAGLPTARSSTLLWTGCAAVAVATLLATLLPWRRIDTSWWLVVPCLDLVAVGLIRADLLPGMAAIGVLAALPAIWLGGEFGRRGVALAALGGAFLFFVPALGPGPLILASSDWSRLLLWEMQTAGLALFAHVVAVELRRRDLRGRAILNSVVSGVAVYDVRGRLLLANAPARTLAELGGYDLAQPDRPGLRVRAADGSTPVPGPEQALARACRAEHLPETLEWLGPDHQLSAVGWSARRMYADDGTVLGTVVVCHDLTVALAARRSQEQFLGTVSHELRTPLTSIVGFVDVAESLSSEDDLALRRSLAAIRRNSDQLADRVVQLLSAAEETTEVRPERTDLSVLLGSALARWQTLCGELGLRLESDCGEDLHADVDPHQIVRVVDALISNATKFTASGGGVRVRLCGEAGHLRLEVADTGVGMTAHDRDRAFDRFHRGDAARVAAVQGVGLGLQTVKRVVEAHRGTVVVDSEPGRGTTVTVRVPAARRSSLAG